MLRHLALVPEVIRYHLFPVVLLNHKCVPAEAVELSSLRCTPSNLVVVIVDDNTVLILLQDYSRPKPAREAPVLVDVRVVCSNTRIVRMAQGAIAHEGSFLVLARDHDDT